MSDMILAQLTDMHIKPPGQIAYRQVDTATCLAAAIDALGRLARPPDAVLFTGDLVDGGLPEEYALLRRLLSPLAMPLYLLPGNHDDRAALRAAFPDHAHLGGDGPIRYVVEQHAVRLIILDSVIPGSGGGRLGPEQIAWLDAMLSAAPHRPTMVALHHPPFRTMIGHMDEIGLADAAALEEVVRRHPQIERILSGHLHRPIHMRWAGTIASTAPSTAHQLLLDLGGSAPPGFRLEPPGYQLHVQVPGSGIVSHTALVGDWPGPFPFFEDGALIA